MAVIRLHGKDKPYDAQKEREGNRIGRKIQELRIKSGMRQKELSVLLEDYGVNVTPAAISKWEMGDAVPNPYQLYALSSALHCERFTDFFADTECGRTSELNEEGQEKVREFVKILIASGLYQSKPAPQRIRVPKIPCVSLRVFDLPASAGSGSFVDSDAYEELSFPESEVPAGADFGIRVYGKSMMPRYRDGQIAMVHRQEALRPGEIGIFLVDGEAYIKEYTESAPSPNEIEDYTAHDGTVYPKITLVSLNPAYKNVPVRPGQALNIIGKVLN